MAETAPTETRLPELLTVPEIAAYLGVPISTIHFWRGRNQGPPALKVGRHLMFRATDVAAWLDERAAPAREPKPSEMRTPGLAGREGVREDERAQSSP
jgi:excisionase family DNA binding protein